MMAKKSTAALVASTHTLKLEQQPGQSHDEVMAQAATSATASSAMIIFEYSKSVLGPLPLTELLAALKSDGERAHNGDLRNAEMMLASQAIALNSMFAELARRAAANMGQYLDVTETYLKLSLKAQNQCRATLETLAAMKNPPTVFAKQANIAHGPQQVNNTVSLAPAEKNEIRPTKLLEQDHGERLDTRTARTASTSNSTVEAVAASYRPAQRTGKGRSKP
jgi:hypothetical protein